VAAVERKAPYRRGFVTSGIGISNRSSLNFFVPFNID
jgi:hypothetical protein